MNSPARLAFDFFFSLIILSEIKPFMRLIFLFLFCWQNVFAQVQVEEFLPQFETGDDSLLKFIDAVKIIPEEAVYKRKEGHVLVSFEVFPDGESSRPKIMMSTDTLFEREALRIARLTACHWKPGTRNGIPVTMNVNLPIHFFPCMDTASVELSDSTLYVKAEIMPKFEGGERAMFQFLQTSLKYPPRCREEGHQGKIEVSFIINKTGDLIEPKIVEGIDEDIDKEVLRVVQLMRGKWTPGLECGRPVSVRYLLPMNFILLEGEPTYANLMGMPFHTDPRDGINWLKIQDSETLYEQGLRHLTKQDTINALEYFKKAAVLNSGHRDAIYNVAVLSILAKDIEEACRYIDKLISLRDPDGENLQMKYCRAHSTNEQQTLIVNDRTNQGNREVMPQFKGGNEELFKFLRNSIQYPEAARSRRVEGVVKVCFTIDSTGAVVGEGILSSPDSSLHEEALRLIRSTSGHWIPGMFNGKPVSVKFTLPINFVLPQGVSRHPRMK